MRFKRFILVPSGEMSPDGSEVGGNTASRINVVLFYEDEMKVDGVVLSGGILRAGQKRSDAEVMHDYLVEIAKIRATIILEKEAADTFENIRFSMKAIDDFMLATDGPIPDVYQVIVPSEKNHLRRFELGFKRLNQEREESRRREGAKLDNVPIEFIGEEAGRRLSLKEKILEIAFFYLVVLPDPLGARSKIAAHIREGRRKAGRS